MNRIKTEADRVAEIGEELYRSTIRSQVDKPENLGKMIIIDVETGEFELDDIGLNSARHLRSKRPNAQLYGIRIGYSASVALGGVLERTPK